MFQPIPTRRTFEGAVEQIVQAIEAGTLDVGERLPPERTLAREFAISRPTVREAIRVLADSGVLKVVPGPAGGIFVESEVVPRGLIQENFRLRLSEVSGVLEARRLVEPQVAQVAAIYATDDDFARLARTIETQRQRLDNEGEFVDLDQRFHLAIARATRNETAIVLMRTLLRRLAIARELALRAPLQPELAISIHERTLRAIMRRDPEEITVAMDEHLSYLERAWEEESGARLRPLPLAVLPAAIAGKQHAAA